MAGDSVPYHLRTNKFIEREIFCELLSHIAGWQKFDTYLYASMGGAFLSDFKLLHTKLGLAKMISLEKEPHVVSRQLFNRSTDLIKCELLESAAFISQLDAYMQQYAADNIIAWLDYANANQRQEQIREFSSLLNKLGHNDIAKITLNCSAHTLYDQYKVSSLDEKQQMIYDNLQGQLGDLFDSQKFSPSQMNNTGVCSALIAAVRRVSLDALEGDKANLVQPLAITRYQDGMHEMLTISLIILKREDLSSFMEETSIQSWPFFCSDWTLCKSIAIPELSFKERECVDDVISAHETITPQQVNYVIPFSLAATEASSAKRIGDYMALRKYSPYVFFSNSPNLPALLKEHATHLL